jgi:hypothetical protein
MSGLHRVAALVVALVVGWPSESRASGPDWLVLLIDRSRSIDKDELALQRRAYARLLNDPEVISALGDAQIAIVEFDSKAEIMVDWASPRAAAELYALQDPKGLRRQTGIGNALATAADLLKGKRGRMVVDVSGDGRENIDPARLRATRAAMSDRAIEINGLAIQNGKARDIERYYSQKVVNGFVLSAKGGTDFEIALQRKLFYEIAGEVPEDATVAGFARSRQATGGAVSRDAKARARARPHALSVGALDQVGPAGIRPTSVQN